MTPWDLPSMFFWTTLYLFWQRNYYLQMLAVFELGHGFQGNGGGDRFLFVIYDVELAEGLDIVRCGFCCLRVAENMDIPCSAGRCQNFHSQRRDRISVSQCSRI